MADKVGVVLAEHFVAHTRDGDRSLVEPTRARWLWSRMREAFPRADAFELMPDHPHLLTPPGSGDRFGRVLRHFTACFGTRFDVPPPTPVHGPKILVRGVGYCFRNPVEAGYVTDPWAWPWSTLRDLAGLVADPWTTVGRLARRCETTRAELLARVTNLSGVATPGPCPVPAQLVASLEACRAAVCATLRCLPHHTERRGRPRQLLIALLGTLTPATTTTALADTLGCNRRTVARARATPDRALPQALRALADPRLRVHDVCPTSGQQTPISPPDLAIVPANGTFAGTPLPRPVHGR